jgi:hypothetical protein
LSTVIGTDTLNAVLSDALHPLCTQQPTLTAVTPAVCRPDNTTTLLRIDGIGLEPYLAAPALAIVFEELYSNSSSSCSTAAGSGRKFIAPATMHLERRATSDNDDVDSDVAEPPRVSRYITCVPPDVGLPLPFFARVSVTPDLNVPNTSSSSSSSSSSSESAVIFTVHDPIVTGMSPQCVPVTGGTTVTLKGSSLYASAALAVRLSWLDTTNDGSSSSSAETVTVTDAQFDAVTGSVSFAAPAFEGHVFATQAVPVTVELTVDGSEWLMVTPSATAVTAATVTAAATEAVPALEYLTVYTENVYAVAVGSTHHPFCGGTKLLLEVQTPYSGESLTAASTTDSSTTSSSSSSVFLPATAAVRLTAHDLDVVLPLARVNGHTESNGFAVMKAVLPQDLITKKAAVAEESSTAAAEVSTSQAAVECAVALNGVDYSAQTLHITLYEDPVYTAVAPVSIKELDGSAMTVKGSGIFAIAGCTPAVQLISSSATVTEPLTVTAKIVHSAVASTDPAAPATAATGVDDIEFAVPQQLPAGFDFPIKISGVSLDGVRFVKAAGLSIAWTGKKRK